MDLWQLQIFCKVIELKSFSKAGQALSISQPTISSHIKDLESHFGCRLIDRLAKHATATPSGQELYRHAKRMLAMRDETEVAIANLHQTIRGRLQIGASTIPSCYLLPMHIHGFIQQYPLVRIQMHVGDSKSIAANVMENVLEMGVVGAHGRHRRLWRQEVATDQMRLIVPADHRWANRATVAVKELLAEPFIARESGSGTRRSIDMALAAHGKGVEDLRITAEVGSTEAVRQCIKNKIGVSILSMVAVAEEITSDTLRAVPIDGLDLARSFYLIGHRDRTLSPAAQAFRAIFKPIRSDSESARTRRPKEP